MKTIYGLTILFLTMSTPAFLEAQGQGITIVETETVNGATHTVRFQMDGQHLRMETSDNSNRGMVMIFDGPAQKIQMLNPEAKNYTEVAVPTREVIDRVISSMPAAFAANSELIHKKLEYLRTGAEQGQQPCVLYEGSRKGEKVQEICMADGTIFGLTQTDINLVKDSAKLLRYLFVDMDPMGENPAEVADPITLIGIADDQRTFDIPIWRTEFRNGIAHSTLKITEVHKGTFPASSFQAPADFKAQTPPGLPPVRQ